MYDDGRIGLYAAYTNASVMHIAAHVNTKTFHKEEQEEPEEESEKPVLPIDPGKNHHLFLLNLLSSLWKAFRSVNPFPRLPLRRLPTSSDSSPPT